MKKKEPSYTVDADVNWYNHFGEQYGNSLKKLKIELLYNPEILFLGTYPEKNVIQKDTCTPVFIAALFPIAKIWKQNSQIIFFN